MECPHECGQCTHYINSSAAPGPAMWGPHFLQKEPHTEVAGYGPAERYINIDCVIESLCKSFSGVQVTEKLTYSVITFHKHIQAFSLGWKRNDR